MISRMECFGKTSAMSSDQKKKTQKTKGKKKEEKKNVREYRFCSKKSGHLSFGPTLVCNGIIGTK